MILRQLTSSETFEFTRDRSLRIKGLRVLFQGCQGHSTVMCCPHKFNGPGFDGI
jgi:hypothetical protein